ncbi:hypothetical protein B0533_06170 [Sedimentibacter sp. SX930]|nr:hypothetical protein B0533_06170 [Sedimentibacter sp. SX930]
MNLLTRLYNYTKKRITRNRVLSNPKFNSLAPSILKGEELEKNRVYIEALQEALYVPENKNIAIVGNYGSGKTSIINTFMDMHKEFIYLKLSLAAFVDEDYEVTAQPDVKEKPRDWELLENSLVKQMVYQQKKSKMPYSSFKRINNVSNVVFFWHTFFLGLFILAWLILNQVANFSNVLPENVLEYGFLKEGLLKLDFFKNSLPEVISLTSAIKGILWAILIMIGGYYLNFMLRLFATTFKLSKLSFSAFTVESSSNDNSYFSKFLDEILYFFETSEANVVFIEDIDRFNNLEVFEHLRELNYLINNSKQIHGPVKFVYAIKDSIFQIESSDKAMKESSEYVRTKFFDFILPIIPVVDSNNSSEFLVPKMREILGVNLDGSKKSAALDIKMERFLLDISIYVDDLRLIYNICNEFRIYKDNLKKRLKNLEYIDDKKLMSIIVYKNIMPKDFAQLQSKKGNLYRIFHEEKEQLLSDLRRESEQRKTELEKKLVNSDKDTFRRAEAAIGGLISQKVHPNYLKHGYLKRNERGQTGNSFPYFAINEVMVGDFLDSSQDILYYTGNAWNAFPRDEIRNQFYLVGLKDEFTYEEFSENERTKIITEIQAVKKELAFLQTKRMRDLVNLNEAFKVKLMDMVPEYSLLLLYLIGEGYIDEQYENYISNIYENTLSHHDSAIIRKLKANVRLIDDEQFENFELAVHKLYDNDLQKPAILHKSIILGIFKAGSYSEKRNPIIETFQDRFEDADKALLLEKLFSESNRDSEQFVRMILEKNKKLFRDLIPYISDEAMKDEFIYRIFYSCRIELVKSCLENDEKIQHQIEKIPAFVPELRKKEIGSVEDFKDVFQTYPFKFKDAGMFEMEAEEFDCTLKNNMYEINKKNLFSIFVILTNLDEDMFSLSALLGMNMPELEANINENFKLFVTVLDEMDALHENGEMLIQILNNTDLAESRKLSILGKNSNPVNDVSDIADATLRKAAFENDKFDTSLKNFVMSVQYGVEHTFKYLSDENVIERLVTELRDDDNTEETIKLAHSFMEKVINENGYDVLAVNIPFFSEFKAYSAEGMSPATFDELLNRDCIPLSVENINVLHGEMKMKLIQKDEAASYQIPGKTPFTNDEIILGLEMLEAEMLSEMIEASFLQDKLTIEKALEIKWIEQIIKNGIHLSAARINNIISMETLREQGILLEFLVYLITEKLLSLDEIQMYLPFVSKSLSSVKMGERGKKTVDKKFYPLLKEIEKLQMISRVSLVGKNVIFYNKG